MKGENFNISGRKARVLVAPLEWGLGHATRCIPIIHELLAGGCEVLIGAEGAAKTLLQQEFPQISFLPLRGYRMQYSRKSSWLPLKLLLQFPKMIRSIYNEHRWLKKLIEQEKIDAVISDNRFGLYNTSIPCIYITHQLTIKTGNRFTQWIAQKIHYRFINKYTACWVPDAAGDNNLAGELSHPKHVPKIPVKYLGPLSRFEKNAAAKKYELTVIISGPEPQRTIFEELLLNELRHYKEAVLFVRGLPGNFAPAPIVNSNIEIQDHLSATAMNEAIEGSELIISRSGYTTIMDLVKLQRNAILVPTPGQTEQEYLGTYLMEKELFYCAKQNEFSLVEVLNKFSDLSFTSLAINQEEYKTVVKKFIATLKAN